ncbi:MAG: protein YgfX [Pseudomonadota bacterium]|nr:protein YgfX [Pseudomonadota bacterium]
MTSRWIELRPSRSWRAVRVAVLGCWAFAAGLAAALGEAAWLTVAVAVGGAMWLGERRALPVCQLGWSDSGLQWAGPDGKRESLHIGAGLQVSTGFVAMGVRDGSGRRRAVLLFADSMAEPDWRALRAWLRWSSPNQR